MSSNDARPRDALGRAYDVETESTSIRHSHTTTKKCLDESAVEHPLLAHRSNAAPTQPPALQGNRMNESLNLLNTQKFHLAPRSRRWNDFAGVENGERQGAPAVDEKAAEAQQNDGDIRCGTAAVQELPSDPHDMRSCCVLNTAQSYLTDETPDRPDLRGDRLCRKAAFHASPISKASQQRLESRRNRLWRGERANSCHDTKRPLMVSEVASRFPTLYS